MGMQGIIKHHYSNLDTRNQPASRADQRVNRADHSLLPCLVEISKMGD